MCFLLCYNCIFHCIIYISSCTIGRRPKCMQYTYYNNNVTRWYNLLTFSHSRKPICICLSSFSYIVKPICICLINSLSSFSYFVKPICICLINSLSSFSYIVRPICICLINSLSSFSYIVKPICICLINSLSSFSYIVKLTTYNNIIPWYEWLHTCRCFSIFLMPHEAERWTFLSNAECDVYSTRNINTDNWLLCQYIIIQP